MPELTDLSVIRALCEKYDFALSKGFGQNFIINPGIPTKIVDASGVDKRYGVIEIGPGIGVLTKELALIMGVIIFIAGLPALVGVHITGALLFLAAVINFGRMAFRPAGDLACGQVVAVVHPNVITGLFQLFQHAGLTGAQQVAHGAVAAHMGI